MSKSTNINIRVPAELKQELTSFAEAKSMDLTQFLLEEIFLKLRGYFVKCPACGKPCFDEREIPITGKAIAVCKFCNYEFEHEF